MTTVYLGTHRPTWLTLDGPPLMVSLNTLPKSKSYRAVVPWFLDSGGFTELQQHGRWRTTAAEHVERCRSAQERFGMIEWMSPQDWMCEPMMLERTGLTVGEHQRRTVANYVELVSLAPDMPWVPVVQGFAVDEYHACVDLYSAAGVDLTLAPLVGVGSVCRRQSMGEAHTIMDTLSERGLSLHGFGFKQAGLTVCWPWLTSVDSMAWSFNARHEKRSCGRPNGRGGVVKSCGNCRHYALDWYQRTSSLVGTPIQQSLPVCCTHRNGDRS